MIRKLLDEITGNNILAEGKYMYNGQYVPRVTELLSSMLHEDYLMTWANNLGLFQRKKYSETLEEAALIGTWTHQFIDDYIQNNSYKLSDSGISNIKQLKSISNGVESFMLWYKDIMKNNQIEIVALEQELSCSYFGGTLDLLIRINGKLYLGDFKTSNHIGYKYFLQLSAYKYMLSLQGIEIEGCIILQVDKKKPSYEEYVLDFNNQEHKAFIDLCLNTFFSITYAYYNRVQVEQQFKNIFGSR